MQYAASHSSHSSFRTALQQAARETATQLQGQTPDLSFFFLSRDHAEEVEELAAEIAAATGSRRLLGCTGETVVGGSQELENGPAFSLWSAVLPDAKITPFHVEFERTPEGLLCTGLPELPPATSAQTAFLLGDPFTCAADALIRRMADDFPEVPLLGGMASGGTSPGENRLYLDGKQIDHGGVGVIVEGGPRIESVVSQGCRPIGSPFVVTRANQNLIFELGGKKALERFQEVFGKLSAHDRSLVQRGLHLGIVLNEYQPVFTRGDFLITNVMGADQEAGAIAIGNLVRVGQTVQFHVRDAETADEDLRQLVGEYRNQQAQPPAAALLFSCNGRGTRLFAEPNHDAGVIQELCGPLPLAGFFAQGELGPVGKRNHIHGYTASLALFGG